MKKIALLIASLAIFTLAQAQDNPFWMPSSKILTETIHSDILGADRAYNIFLPKSYDLNPEQKYPILYLLHGMYDTNQGWTMRGHLQDVMDQLVASGEACEMIIVTPNAGGNPQAGEINGYFNIPDWAYEDFFFNEFLPTIESKYRAIGTRETRAIAGLSMGGGGTTSYAQRHPELFCAAYAMSALMNIPAFNLSPDRPMAPLTASVVENSCIKYVAEASEDVKAALRSVKWYVDCGDDDFLFDVNMEFIQAMKRAGIPYELRVRDGGHTWEYWHSALYTCLPFMTRCFAK